MISKTLDEITDLDVPNTDHAIRITSSDKPPVMRNSDTERLSVCVQCNFSLKNSMSFGVQIPDTYRAIVRAGDNESTILRIVKRANPALMALERCVNPLVLDIPDLVLMRIECQLLQKQLQCDEGGHV